jgi:hypothetical protein
MRLSEFLIFVASLLVSVFLLGLGMGLWPSDRPSSLAAILAGLLINGLVHFFFWKKFWDLLKSLRRP